MEYIKKEELKNGDVFVSQLLMSNWLNKQGTNFYLMLNKDNTIAHKTLSKTGGFSYENIRLATSEEKHWLNTCIEQDKFITFEEAMKSFIPEYVECIIEQPQYGNYGELGKIYKVDNWNHSTQDCLLNGTTSHSTSKNRFKPSTKEAYDAQFVVKEPEFVLPEKWCLKITKENLDFCKSLENNELHYKKNYNYCVNGYYSAIRSDSGNYGFSGIPKDFTEITFEQFKKYVLKEEIVEEKVIEPLPQFKVIETIETITKVENNEGNQFFIGDVVIGSKTKIKSKIISFKYNVDKTAILAITDKTSNIGIGINHLEHYIEPKVEDDFILPEKWGILRTNENDKIVTDYINKIASMQHSYLPNNLYNPYLHNKTTGCCSYYKVIEDYTEITFNQFKKYVLKEEVKDETLLEKAKRLYPVGTKFRVACNPKYIGTVKDHKDYPFQDVDIVNLNTIENIDGCTGMTVFYKGKWAEIINE